MAHTCTESQDYTFTTSARTGNAPLQEFPAAGYGPLDFHCERALNSWTDPLDLNAGWLTGLTDLNTERDNVQERIAAYMTDLLSIGFSGFRMDAAKHIQPDDIVGIFSKLKRNMGGEMPDDWITWLEVLLGGEKDMLMCDENSGYNYGAYLEKALIAGGFSDEDVEKVKIWNSGYPKEPDAGACTIKKSRNAIQVSRPPCSHICVALTHPSAPRTTTPTSRTRAAPAGTWATRAACSSRTATLPRSTGCSRRSSSRAPTASRTRRRTTPSGSC